MKADFSFDIQTEAKDKTLSPVLFSFDFKCFIDTCSELEKFQFCEGFTDLETKVGDSHEILVHVLILQI